MGSSVVKVKMKMLRSLLALALLSSQGQSSTTVHSSPSDTVHASRQARDTFGRFPTPGQVQREGSLLDRYNQQKALISSQKQWLKLQRFFSNILKGINKHSSPSISHSRLALVLDVLKMFLHLWMKLSNWLRSMLLK